MSEMSVRLFTSLCLFLALAVAGGLGFAVASSPTAITDIISAPALPSLLGPIEESGRVGWACVPEREAGTKGWKDARLPVEPAR